MQKYASVEDGKEDEDCCYLRYHNLTNAMIDRTVVLMVVVFPLRPPTPSLILPPHKSQSRTALGPLPTASSTKSTSISGVNAANNMSIDTQIDAPSTA